VVIRRLNSKDWDLMDKIILDNQGASKTAHMPEFTKMVRESHYERLQGLNPGRKGADDTLSRYYGTFDSDNKLVTWAHWRIWDNKDQPDSVTYGSNYVSCDREHELVGPFWVASVIDMTNYAVRELHDLGIRNIYTLRTGPPDKPVGTGWHRKRGLEWVSQTTLPHAELGKYDWSELGYIRVGEPITNPLWAKYLWGGPSWFPATVTVGKRKLEN
jgi:hypothetical protein